MLETTRKYTCYALAIINIAVIAAALLTGYAGCFNPIKHPYLAASGLAYPGFVVCNILFFVVWAFIKKRYVLLPAIGMLLNIDLLMDYSPLNISCEQPSGCIKVISYNVLGFNYSQSSAELPNEILQYIIDSEADVICLQEYNTDKTRYKEQWENIDSLYPYQDYLTAKGIPGETKSGDCIGVLSKYPILSKEYLPIKSKGNVAGVFTVKLHGKIVRFINTHLESVGLTIDERNDFNEMVKGDKNELAMKVESKNLITKIATSTKIRAPQADSVGKYILDHKGGNIILCGDFNDHPLSYVHRTIAHNLTDCYRETGHLPGFSFNYGSMYVRIDNIMCSRNFEPYHCHVDKSVKLSDHYPIICYFKQK